MEEPVPAAIGALGHVAEILRMQILGDVDTWRQKEETWRQRLEICLWCPVWEQGPEVKLTTEVSGGFKAPMMCFTHLHSTGQIWRGRVHASVHLYLVLCLQSTHISSLGVSLFLISELSLFASL